MVKRRRRFKQTESLRDRLASFANDAREIARLLPPGPSRDEMLLKVRRAETAAQLDEWVKSPGLQLPKARRSISA
jgi:hypothetical protein